MDKYDNARTIQRLIDKTYKLAICDVSIAIAKLADDTAMVELWEPTREERAKEIGKLAGEILSDLRHRPS